MVSDLVSPAKSSWRAELRCGVKAGLEQQRISWWTSSDEAQHANGDADWTCKKTHLLPRHDVNKEEYVQRVTNLKQT
jgi:hypothetical protein